MTRSSVPSNLRRYVVERAVSLCEYCRLRQDLCPEPFEVDHIIPRAASGLTILENLCLACPVCNNAKRWLNAEPLVFQNPSTNACLLLDGISKCRAILF